MPEFQYDDAKHEYSLVYGSGRVEILPSVTQIIDSAGLINDFSKQEFAALRGSYAHLAARYLFENRLDWSTIDEQILGYAQSLDKWIKTTRFKAEACEVRLYHPLLRFAGTYDVKGVFPSGSRWLIDVKSGVPERWHEIQTMLYMVLEGGYRRRGSLYLQKNGAMAKFREHKNPNDEANAISLLNVYRLKESIK